MENHKQYQRLPPHRYRRHLPEGHAIIPGSWVEGATAGEVHCGKNEYHVCNMFGCGCTNAEEDLRRLGHGAEVLWLRAKEQGAESPYGHKVHLHKLKNRILPAYLRPELDLRGGNYGNYNESPYDGLNQYNNNYLNRLPVETQHQLSTYLSPRENSYLRQINPNYLRKYDGLNISPQIQRIKREERIPYEYYPTNIEKYETQKLSYISPRNKYNNMRHF